MSPPDPVALELGDMPRDDGGPVFREPWEAQAFALVVELQSRGLFTASEWAACLSSQIKHAAEGGDPDLGDTYYQHWLAALERLVVERGIADATSLAATREAWDRAARSTPHGEAIVLDARG